MIITDARWLTPEGTWQQGWIEVNDGRITAAGAGSPGGFSAASGAAAPAAAPGGARTLQAAPGAPTLSAAGRMVAPGLIDIHIHGSDGFDALGDVDEQLGMAGALPRHGVTAYVAAVVSGATDRMEQAVRSIAAARRVQAAGTRGAPGAATGAGAGAAEILGTHLEGPFISPEFKGAHDPTVLRAPSIPELTRWLAASEQSLRMVTLAPELPGGLEAVRWLADHGIVAAIGHTAATYAQVMEAIAAGATHSVHCYNAMSPLRHREPGTVGAVLADDRITAELIADFIHVHPAACLVALRSKGLDRLALVTDAMVAAGMPDGSYRLGSLDVVVRDNSARLADGTLAGSVLTLDRAVRNLCHAGLLTPAEALHHASAVAARVIGVADRKGAIAPGFDADLVCLDDDLSVRWTMARGAMAYQAS